MNKPGRIFLLAASFGALLIPSAAFLWRNADLPQFGERHDDSVFYASAKSLAGGHYRIESLPGQPAQTKYPPLYPLLLSIAWRIHPSFPGNLPLAAFLSWLAMPVLLILLARYYPSIGISGARCWILLLLTAANPYNVLFSATLFSELWFTALLTGVLLVAQRAAESEASAAWAAAAGALSGAAYLTRSAGIVLLGSGALYLGMRRKPRAAAVFAGCMAPFVAAWLLWARLHQIPTADPAWIYYTDYVKYELYIVHWNNLHLVLWKNLDALLWGLGSMVLPKIADSLFVKILAQVLAVAMIAGVVRMARAGRAVHYALFAAGSAFLLVIWHFPPNERFVIPLFPLAIAGLLTEMEHFAAMLRAVRRHKDRSQRVAGAIMAAAAALALAASLAVQAYVTGIYLNDSAARARAQNSDRTAAYAWIRANLPADATVIAYDDPVFYLHTGRAAIRRTIPPSIWYADDHEGAVELYRNLAAYAREQGAQYVYYTTADLRRDMSEDDASAMERQLAANPDLQPVFRAGIGTIYRVRPTAAYTAAPASTITNPGQVVADR